MWNDYTGIGIAEAVAGTGFTDPVAVYATNMASDANLSFSHNLEWLTDEANKAMRDEASSSTSPRPHLPPWASIILPKKTT